MSKLTSTRPQTDSLSHMTMQIHRFRQTGFNINFLLMLDGLQVGSPHDVSNVPGTMARHADAFSAVFAFPLLVSIWDLAVISPSATPLLTIGRTSLVIWLELALMSQQGGLQQRKITLFDNPTGIFFFGWEVGSSTTNKVTPCYEVEGSVVQ